MTSHARPHLTPACRSVLTVVLTLLLGFAMATAAGLPAQAAGDPVVVEDQTFNAVGDQGLSLYLKSSGGTDGDVVRWSISDAPSWVDVQPNGYVTGVVPAGGGTFSFTITGTSGTYAGAPVSQDSATATIIATPLDFNIRLGSSDATEMEVLLTAGLKTRFSANADRREATWTSTPMPPGLTLAADGLVTGAATRPGTFPVTVTVTYRGAVASKTFTFVATSAMSITTGGFGRFPRVTVGRPFAIKMRAYGNVGKTTMSFAAKRPTGYKLKRTSAVTYMLKGKLTTRKKVRVPLRMSDQSGTRLTEVLVVTPYPK